EQALRSKSSNLNARVFDYFNVVVGTSIEGVFIVMFFATRVGTHRLVLPDDTLFQGRGDGGIVMSMEAMERIMKEAFGDRLTLCNIVKQVLISCYEPQSFFSLIFSRANALESESFDF
ncbi:Patatin-like phospholipase, partial [Musa troglodytarum]